MWTTSLSDVISQFRAMEAAYSDQSVLRAIKDAEKMARVESSALRAIQDAQEMARIARVDPSVLRAIKDAEKMARVESSALRAIQDAQEMARIARVDPSVLRAIKDAQEIARVDPSVVRAMPQDSPKRKPADAQDTGGEGDADTNPEPPNGQDASQRDNEENPSHDRDLGEDGDVPSDG
jgi:hypothetical protein